MVTWCKKPYVLPYLIDVASAEMAAEISLRLATLPMVYNVAVTETEYEEDPEMKQRIWKACERADERVQDVRGSVRVSGGREVNGANARARYKGVI